jgi:dihydroorotase
MDILLKNVHIIHPESAYHQQILDILVKDGIISAIGHSLSANEKTQVISHEGLHVSIGFLDIGTQVGDPGYEHRETFQSATLSASRGGYTALAVAPNALPVVHSKSEVAYIRKSTAGGIVDFLPIGAVSQNANSQEISEMYDMHTAGAVAFSDGKNSLAHSGLMVRALQYVQPFNGLIINHPHDAVMAEGGQMHEGRMSTMLGMKGIPAIAEELMLQRDIELCAYTNGRLLVQNISTKRSVELIREAKKRGLQITASVAAMNLYFTDEALAEFDSNLKVNPPLRGLEDKKALKKGLKDGTIDLITSNHVPLDEESKNLEFPYAKFGAVSLDATFAAIMTHTNSTAEQVCEKLAFAPRRILNLDIPKIEVGAQANLCFFDPLEKWTYTAKDNFSKSKNTPWIGCAFVGKVLGTIHNGQMSLMMNVE